MRKPIPELRNYWPVTIIIIALLFGGIFYSSAISKFAEGQLFADEMIFQEQTTYQRIVVTKHPRNGEVRLYLDGHLQFAQSDEHRYHESLVHPVMSCGGLPRRVLILGGGDGLAIREVLKYSTVESIDLVDIDPRMTELSKSFGPIVRMNQNSLDDPKVTIYHEDAFNFVQKAYLRLSEENRLYDRIIIDLPDPHSEVLNKLYTKEFYGLIARVLSDDGSLVTQSASPIVTREAFWCINKTMESADFRVLPFRGFLNSFGEWGFNLAVKKSSSINLDSIMLTDVPRRHLSTDAFRVASQFAIDDGPLTVPVNTLFEPKLYMLYEMGLKR